MENVFCAFSCTSALGKWESECELASSVSWKMFFALFLASGAVGSDGGQEGEMVSGSKRGTSCENLSRLAMLYQYQSDENLSQYL